MEPDVIRMYSSSPPPLDEDGEEEDEDGFGEFGGYCCSASSSFGFSEYDLPANFAPSYEPPDLRRNFIQNTVQPGKDSALKEMEKITEHQETPNPDSLLRKTDVDCGNKIGKVSEVLPNGPLAPTSQMELSVVSNVGKHSTLEIQDFKPLGNKEPSDNPNTDQLQHCLSNGPITICTDEELETVTSTNSTEPRTEDSSPDTNQAASADVSGDSGHLSNDNGSQTDTSEPGDARFHEVVGDDQCNKEKLEFEQTPEDPRSGLCGLPTDSEISGDVGNVADASLTPDGQLKEKVEDWNINIASPVAIRHPVGPGGVELEEGIAHDAKADIREVKRIGSSNESDEDFGDFRDATQGFPDSSQTESVSQEGFADFVTALSDCSSHDEFADPDALKDSKEEEEPATEDKDADKDNETSDTNDHEATCSALPPSDSFADFSSAPFGGTGGTAGESWAEFGLQDEREMQQESWASFDEEQQGHTATAPPSDGVQSDNVLFGLTHKLQHVFESTFPLESTPEDCDVLTLQALLEPQDHAEIREPVAMWRHLLDIHSAHGLKIQWVGSHSNRILLDCLGIYNILFSGQSKQPVIVPMFAAGLGMLEPTKEPVKHLSIFSSSSPGQGRSALCAQQVVSSLIPEDDAPGGAVSHLNLDFFGPSEECSSDSDTDAPIPGVDPELYELTTAKLESNIANSNVGDAFTRLMETVEKKSTATRKSERDGEISQEASQVISLLPDLSFMHARVLMFPSTLTPAVSHP